MIELAEFARYPGGMNGDRPYRARAPPRLFA